MRQSFLVAVLAASFAAPVGPQAASAAQKMRLHQCVTTRITQLASRLVGLPDSGSFVEYANGVQGVSYDVVPAVKRSRVGDPIRLCLSELPQGCPKGDDRGKYYTARNLRTRATWVLADAEHQCGGA